MSNGRNGDLHIGHGQTRNFNNSKLYNSHDHHNITPEHNNNYTTVNGEHTHQNGTNHNNNNNSVTPRNGDLRRGIKQGGFKSPELPASTDHLDSNGYAPFDPRSSEMRLDIDMNTDPRIKENPLFNSHATVIDGSTPSLMNCSRL